MNRAASTASYGYTAYGADESTLASGHDAGPAPSPGAFPFNSYRFGAGRLDPSTSNLDLGGGTYNPNINGFISRAGIAGAPSGANAPSRPLTWGDALSFAGDLFLNWGWIQQSVHTIFQTNASAGDKAWAAASLVGAVGLDALQVTPAGWLSDAAKVIRLAKGADEAVTAGVDAAKLAKGADEAITATSDADKTITAADEAVNASHAVASSGDTLEFAHGTSLEDAQSIASGGLNSDAAKAASKGGRYSQPGSFFTFNITEGGQKALQEAYIFGKNTADEPVVLVGKMPRSLFEQLVAEGIDSVEIGAIPGGELPEIVFKPGTFGRLNGAMDWRIIDPYGRV